MSKKIVAINGSPRTDWNTAQMVKSAAKGAQEAGAEVKYYDIFKLNTKGCYSCFGCRRLGNPDYAKCNIHDDLTPVLDDILSSDGLLLGSPIYCGDVTASVRALCERLWFPGIAYSTEHKPLYERRIPTKLLFTMNAPSHDFHKHVNEQMLHTFSWIIGDTEIIEATETLQFDDYAKYETTMFDVQQRIDRHRDVFPQDLQNAYNAGKALAL
ncbi:MAG: flavodoxin family protein [Oscillospiraceae bacterium]|jgi:multimeric flavodoxin WrbA|nr:flavodoxin family protein [Oscillospiraceae bacterium]